MITDTAADDAAADELENNDAEMIISFLHSVLAMSIFLMRKQHISYKFTIDLQTFISKLWMGKMLMLGPLFHVFTTTDDVMYNI